MNGPAAAKAIRELGYTGAIIGITGNAAQGERDEFVECGADEVFVKPMALEAFDRLVTRFCAAKERSVHFS